MSIGPWDFNGFDIVVLLVLLISLIMAASRGFMREVISIAALVLAAAVALFVFGRFRFAAQDFISPDWLADGALGLGTFVLVYLIMVMLFSGVTKSLRGKEVGFIDRIMGGGFGVARGLLLVSLVVMAFTTSYHDKKAAQEYLRGLEANGQDLSPEDLEGAPQAIRDLFEKEDAKLPALFENSTFYPILERIGDGIRALPFARMRTMADRLQDGDLQSIIDGINSESDTNEPN